MNALPTSGFLRPTVFSEKLVDFFNIANVGPLVNGLLTEKINRAGHTRLLPNTESLQGLDAPLNGALYFTMPEINGQPNPLYRIIAPGILTPLFALHTYYTNMTNPNNATLLSASDDMRRYLRETMVKIIRNDAQKVILRHIDNYNAIDRATRRVPLFIENINGAVNEIVNNNLGDERIFNPNEFLYAEFSKIIAISKLPVDINWDELRPLIRQVYSDIIPHLYFDSFGVAFNELERIYQGEGYPPYEEIILKYQRYLVTLARSYKSNIQQHAIRAARRNQIYELPPLIEVPQKIFSTIDFVLAAELPQE